MTVLRILQYPDPRLRTVAKKVDIIDERIEKIVADMFETHYAADNCAALAATQLDIENPPFITVIDFSPERDQPLCLINGEIIASEGQRTEEEGCMSVGTGGAIFEKVTRADTITVRALNEKGEQLEFGADGFMAKCIQHELDHLNGKIYLDRLSKLRRGRTEKRLQKFWRSQE